MFSKAKQKQTPDKKSHNSEPPKELTSAHASQTPSKRSSPMKSAGVPSLISTDVVMKGNINSSGEVQFDGSLEGDIRASCLIIGEKAIVNGEVICETVTVRGKVDGGIRAKSVSLASTAHIHGNILHSSLSVETGAHFEGNCRHSDDPLSEAAAKDFRRARPVGGAPTPGPKPTTSATDIDVDDLSGANAPVQETSSFLNQSRSPLR